MMRSGSTHRCQFLFGFVVSVRRLVCQLIFPIAPRVSSERTSLFACLQKFRHRHTSQSSLLLLRAPNLEGLECLRVALVQAPARAGTPVSIA